MTKMTLKASRVNAGYTMRVASKQLGVAFTTLVRWEKNPDKVQAWQQLKLSDLYKTPIEDIEWVKRQELPSDRATD